MNSARTGERGSGLITAIIAVAVFGIISAVLVNANSQRLKAAGSQAQSSDVDAIAAYFKSVIDCNETVRALSDACDVGDAGLALKRYDGKPLVVVPKSTADYTIIGGQYAVKAHCVGGAALKIEVARAKPKLGEWKNLFKKGNLLCEEIPYAF